MISTQLHEHVLHITLDNAPVNALQHSLRLELLRVINAAQSDDQVQAIVIGSAGKVFSAGADISEFDAPLADPPLPKVCDVIEASAKPIVAAIGGAALGGGLEIALSCHYRFASPDAVMGLPEVKLGLLPGAGGTQRLPRLVGVEAALGMIVSGDPVSAKYARDIGLVDAVVERATIMDEAADFIRKTAKVRPTGERKLAYDAATFDRFIANNARTLEAFEAPKCCVEAVRAAAQLPIVSGMAVESALFAKLIDSDESRALRHIFFAERKAPKIDGLSGAAPRRQVERVGIIGAGTMGAGISMNFLSAGIPVTLLDMTQDALNRGVGTVHTSYAASVAKGRLSAEQETAATALLRVTLDFADLGDCDLVIEAVYEDLDTKKAIFRQLDAVARPGAILASNTSYLDLNDIASATSRPRDVVGLHFFSPANIMKLVEVVRGDKTAPDVLNTATRLAQTIGKIPVVAGVCYGFIGNRMLIPRQSQAEALLLEGAEPEQIDRVHTDFGMPMGPFQMADLAGVDIGWHRDPDRIESISDALCSRRRWGQKTKGGYYDYDDRRRPTPSPVTQGIVARFRADAGVTARQVDDEEIIVRTLYTMVNEAALILEEGIAQRASDIDVVWAYGYGWPKRTGGPVFWADTIGLDKIVSGLEKFAHRLGPDFRISPLLRERAASRSRLGQ